MELSLIKKSDKINLKLSESGPQNKGFLLNKGGEARRSKRKNTMSNGEKLNMKDISVLLTESIFGDIKEAES
jgi:hypothetical protein